MFFLNVDIILSVNWATTTYVKNKYSNWAIDNLNCIKGAQTGHYK